MDYQDDGDDSDDEEYGYENDYDEEGDNDYDDDGGDIYTMVQCLSVTFLLISFQPTKSV